MDTILRSSAKSTSPLEPGFQRNSDLINDVSQEYKKFQIFAKKKGNKSASTSTTTGDELGEQSFEKQTPQK